MDGIRLVACITAAFDLQDPDKFKSRMHSLAYGQAMAAAARDYQKVSCTTMACLGIMLALGADFHWRPTCATILRLLVQEMLSESRASVQSQGRGLDVDDLLDDPELERLHAERLAAMQREAEKRVQLQRKGHGELQEVCLKCSHSEKLVYGLNGFLTRRVNISSFSRCSGSWRALVFCR